jgi:hypothetical protein
MPLIPFAEWRPDSPALGPFAREALNVVPNEESYRPLNSLATTTNALTARAQGAAWFRGTAGATKMFAGDATKLYLLSGATWTSVPQLDGARNITGITQANPGVVSYTGADPTNGQTVYVKDVVGMTQVNGLFFTVANVNAGANTFELSGVDTSAYTAWSSGGTVQVATIYAPGADGAWRFTQFGSLAIAVNGVDPPQKFDLAAGTNFAALGGSPPVGTYIATVRDFVVMGKIGSTPQRVQWSPFNNAEGTWGSVAATQADYQDLPDGGNITGLVGGEYGLVFSESAVRRMNYETPPVVFRLDKISNDIGCSVPGSLASVLDLAFFLHKSGFHMIKGGQQIVPIGHQKVDRTFYAEFDETNMARCSSAVDPVRQLYLFAYPANGNGGTPNRLLIYDWSANRFARAAIETELIFGGVSQQAYTLEQLDNFGGGSLDALPYSLDSSYWTGALSLLLFGFYTDHKSGSFSGTTLEATVETGEFNPGNGRRSIIRGCRPLIDGGSPMISIGARETQQAAVVYGSSTGLTAAGLAPVYGSGRYFRARAVIPAGGTWNNAQGIDDLDIRPGGLQ